jgi:hypothetical protein
MVGSGVGSRICWVGVRDGDGRATGFGDWGWCRKGINPKDD